MENQKLRDVLPPLRGWIFFPSFPTAHAVGYQLSLLRS